MPRFRSQGSFGGSLLAGLGAEDIVVARYAAADGTHLWSKRFGNTGVDFGQGVAIDASGNVIVVGSFTASANFGGTTLVAGGNPPNGPDSFVAKFAADGTHLWSRNFYSLSPDAAKAIAVDANGNLAVTGSMTAVLDLGCGTMVSGNPSQDVYVGKLTANGACVWSKFFGGNDQIDEGSAIAFDASGDVVVTGIFRGNIDLGNGLLQGGVDGDGFLVKYAAATGAALWSRRLGSDLGGGAGLGVATDANKNVTVTGIFTKTVNLGGTDLVSAGDTDIFVAKYAASGAHTWSKRYGAALPDRGRGAAVDAAGNIVVTGYFSDTVDFGGGALTSAASFDGFLLMLTP
jgi:hypothetical protein